MIPSVAAGSLFLLSCSPRKGGNSDTAARLFGEGFGAALREGRGRAAGMPGAICPAPLREYRIVPCTACGACGKAAKCLAGSAVSLDSLAGVGENAMLTPFFCPLTLEDDSAVLLRSLAATPALCLVSPVYFYHFPAMLKGLVDRLQTFWSLRRHSVGGWMPEGGRTCHAILLGARERGEKLFAGSLLTLRYALEPLGMDLAEPLLLYGLDEAGSLAARAGRREEVREYGKEAGLRFLAENAGIRCG